MRAFVGHAPLGIQTNKRNRQAGRPPVMQESFGKTPKRSRMGSSCVGKQWRYLKKHKKLGHEVYKATMDSLPQSHYFQESFYPAFLFMDNIMQLQNELKHEAGKDEGRCKLCNGGGRLHKVWQRHIQFQVC